MFFFSIEGYMNYDDIIIKACIVQVVQRNEIARSIRTLVLLWALTINLFFL